jgi:uncharacterized protein YcbK (DUF882 family)
MARLGLPFAILLAGLMAAISAPQTAEAQRRRGRSVDDAEVESGRRHTVRAGETWVRIAQRYHVTAWDLALANGSRPERSLRPGQSLIVPPEEVVFVRAGQSWAEIAREHGGDPAEIARLNGLRPGSRLRVGQRLELPGYVEPVPPSVDRDWGSPAESGLASIRRHAEASRVRLTDAQGRVTAEGLEQLASFMRRQDTDPPELPHPRLVRLLAAISDHFGSREITVVSGRRPVGGRTRESSRHVSGHATDIRVEGVPARAIWDYCRSLRRTGCGLYPRSTFVHVDVREQPAQWVDWSQPGRRAAYGNLRGPWRRSCARARRGSPPPACSREGREITRPDEIPDEVELTEEARSLMPEVAPLAPGDEPDEGDELTPEPASSAPGDEPDEAGEGDAET